MIRIINGVRHVPAWPWERGAVFVAGDYWRPL